MSDLHLSRRTLLAAAVLFGSPAQGLAQAIATPPPSVRRDLGFTVWRKGVQIGRHHVAFEGGADDFRVAIEAEMLVKFGPIPVFRYHHQATESWQAGRFDALQSHTTSNGRVEEVSARAAPQGVGIARGPGKPERQAPPGAHPLTHWNSAVLEGPLFNPQTGAMVHEHVVRSTGQPLRLANGRDIEAARYVLTGDAQITDWYDGKDAWAALTGRAPDGSTIEYHRDV